MLPLPKRVSKILSPSLSFMISISLNENEKVKVYAEKIEKVNKIIKIILNFYPKV